MKQRILGLLCGVLLASTLLAATGRLRVEATDEAGEALPEVKVTVTVAATNRIFTLVTDPRGRGTFQGIPGGEVIVRFEREGFQIYETNALIQAGTTPEVRAELPRLRRVAREGEKEKAAREAVELYNRAVAKYEAEDPDGASAALERALERDPTLAPAHVLRARIAGDRGDHATAADAYLRAWELEGSPSVLPRLIQALDRAGREDEAAALSQRLDRGASTASPRELYDLAIVEINRGDDAAAGEILDRLLAAAPDFSPAVYQRGVIRLQSGDLDRAREDFERYLELEPEGELAADARAMLEAIGGQGREG